MPKGNKPEPITEKEARSKISRYCAYQERSPKQVRLKLKEYGLTKSETNSVYSWLEEENFVNETRFAGIYALGKFRLKKWGKYKIKKGLLSHEISEQLIEEALALLDEEPYLETIRDLADKKMSLLKGTEENKRVKLMNYLIGKGFEKHLVWPIVNDFKKS